MKKMMLVAAASQFQFRDTNIARALELDDDMENILKRRDLDESQKATSYSQALQKYINIRKHHGEARALTSIQAIAPPPPAPITQSVNVEPTVIAPPSATTSSTPDFDLNNNKYRVSNDSILISVPRTYRVKGQKLVELMTRTPQISGSPTGEVSLRGKIISNSNISELVNDILRHRQRVSPPTGWQSFIEALVEDNIPRDLIGNVQRKSYIKRRKPAKQHQQRKTRTRKVNPPNRPEFLGAWSTFTR